MRELGIALGASACFHATLDGGMFMARKTRGRYAMEALVISMIVFPGAGGFLMVALEKSGAPEFLSQLVAVVTVSPYLVFTFLGSWSMIVLAARAVTSLAESLERRAAWWLSSAEE